MARKLSSITDVEYRRKTKFEDWVRTVAKPVQLVCLINGHVLPDPFALDPAGTPLVAHQLLPAGQHGRRYSTIQLEAPCIREIRWTDELLQRGIPDAPDLEGERCGTVIRKLLGPGGVIAASRPIYDHEHWYHVPPELLEHGWLSKAQRGFIRTYLYVELPELMADMAKRRQRARAKRAKEAEDRSKAIHPSTGRYA